MVIITLTFELDPCQRFCRNITYIWFGSHNNPVAGCISWEQILRWFSGQDIYYEVFLESTPREERGKRKQDVAKGEVEIWCRSWAGPKAQVFLPLHLSITEWGCFVSDGQVILGTGTVCSEAVAEENDSWRLSTNSPPSCWVTSPLLQGDLVVATYPWLGASFLNKWEEHILISNEIERSVHVRVCVFVCVVFVERGARRDWNLTPFSGCFFLKSLLNLLQYWFCFGFLAARYVGS